MNSNTIAITMPNTEHCASSPSSIKWQCKINEYKWSNYNNELSIKFENTAIGEILTFESKNGITNQIKRISIDTAQHSMYFNYKHPHSLPKVFECRRINVIHYTVPNPARFILSRNTIHHEPFCEHVEPKILARIQENKYKYKRDALLAVISLILTIGFLVGAGFIFIPVKLYSSFGSVPLVFACISCMCTWSSHSHKGQYKDDYEKEREYLESGYYQQEHNLKEWQELSSIHLTDYVLSYYSRNYGLKGLHRDIGEILLRYIGEMSRISGHEGHNEDEDD